MTRIRRVDLDLLRAGRSAPPPATRARERKRGRGVEDAARPARSARRGRPKPLLGLQRRSAPRRSSAAGGPARCGSSPPGRGRSRRPAASSSWQRAKVSAFFAGVAAFVLPAVDRDRPGRGRAAGRATGIFQRVLLARNRAGTGSGPRTKQRVDQAVDVVGDEEQRPPARAGARAPTTSTSRKKTRRSSRQQARRSSRRPAPHPSRRPRRCPSAPASSLAAAAAARAPRRRGHADEAERRRRPPVESMATRCEPVARRSAPKTSGPDHVGGLARRAPRSRRTRRSSRPARRGRPGRARPTAASRCRARRRAPRPRRAACRRGSTIRPPGTQA